MREGGAMRWRHGDSPGNCVSRRVEELGRHFLLSRAFVRVWDQPLG